MDTHRGETYTLTYKINVVSKECKASEDIQYTTIETMNLLILLTHTTATFQNSSTYSGYYILFILYFCCGCYGSLA